MNVPRLPNPILQLEPGELVLYRRWCPTHSDWVTDGIPYMVVRESGGIAEVLMVSSLVRIPVSLLKRVDEGCSFFANVVQY